MCGIAYRSTSGRAQRQTCSRKCKGELFKSKWRERFEARISKDDNGCWNWKGSRLKTGYGIFYYYFNGESKTTTAHRAAYLNYVGEIGESLTIDHLCRNVSCVNPVHLESVSMRENVLRGTSITAVNAKKDSCSRGHPLNGENLRITPIGHRVCRACEKMSKDRRKLKGV